MSAYLNIPAAISAVIPAYREASTIERAIKTVAGALEEIGEPYEILVVDNASPDHTADIAREAGAEWPVRVLENDRNRGKGFSVRRGILASRGAWRFFYDADLSTHPSEIARFWSLALANQHDVLVGSRLTSGANVARMQPIRRRLAGRLMLTVSHSLFGPLTDDIFCGYKWFRGETADRIFANVKSTGWVFDLEVLCLAAIDNNRVLEVPIQWENHADTRLKMSRDWLAIGFEMLKTKWNLRRNATRVVLDPSMTAVQSATRINAR